MFGSVGRVMRRVLEARRLRRSMTRVKRVPVAQLTDNAIVRVTGQARPGGPVLEAPLSTRTCVYYAVVIYGWTADGDVRELATETEGIEFTLVEADDRITIDPRAATVSAAFDHEVTYQRQLAPESVTEILRRSGANVQGTVRFECCEAILEVDEMIAAVGAAIKELDPLARPDGGYRDGARGERYRLVVSTAQALMISDDPRTL